MTDFTNKIHLGDCLDVMKELPDNSVDLICTSPPYSDQRKNTYGGIHADKYNEWWEPRAIEMLRILKPTGSFILNIKEKCVDGERHTYVLELVLLMRRLGWRWTEQYIWSKTHAMPGKWPTRFRDAWEHLFHFTAEKKFKMNQDDVMYPVAESTKKRTQRLGENDHHRMESATGSGFGKNISNLKDRVMAYPSNVLHRSPISHDTGHSAAYPEWLPEFFIHLFTDPGDVVLDPFSGSGTTCRVAERMKRVYVGIEVNPDYTLELKPNSLLKRTK